MRKFKLNEMTKGWFVGDFSPCAYKTSECEVAIKCYKKGDSEKRHYHKVSLELTCIVLGRVKMNGLEFKSGDIVEIAPFESTDFMALEDTITCVVKIPSAKNDKFLGEYKANSTNGEPK